MRSDVLIVGMAAVLLGPMAGCERGVPPDEALRAVRREGGEFANLGPGTKPEVWEKAARHFYPPARRDYFEDMDAVGGKQGRGPSNLKLDPDQVVGRNAWVMWTGGNEAWWDWLARYGYGTVDLLKLIDDRGRETRFGRTGLLNEPGTRPPTEKETAEANGVRYARRVETPEPGREVHVDYRKDLEGWAPPDPKVYGWPTGVVGLCLYKNPEFEKTKDRWDPQLYYSDTDEGRRYASDPNTIRPFRVGMSCGYCHIAPHPLKPPADPEFPRWENLSNNVGNQFLRMRVAFANTLEPNNYLYQVFNSMLPGAVDTSGHPSDNNNNPNTVNSFYGLRGRLERAQMDPKELLSPDSLAYVSSYTPEKGPNPRHLPKVLLDGSDSVGVHVALSRVYLNIGTHHQEWIRNINPFLGFSVQHPFKLENVAGNSLYWHAIRIRVQPMASFFMAATDPMRLKDVELPATPGKPNEPSGQDLLKQHLRGTGLPWYNAALNKESATPAAGSPEIVGGPGDYAIGRRVFARGCIACHSSIQPGDLPELERNLALDDKSLLKPVGEIPEDEWSGKQADWYRLIDRPLADRRALRLTNDDRARLTRGDGVLPPAYEEWARKAVDQPEFWGHQARVWDANGDPVNDGQGRQLRAKTFNYLSIDERVPVTVVGTNSGRATGTNSLHGHVWEDFASETYKELDAVGPIRYRDPFSGADKSYSPPGGGLGYYRVPTLISVWATSPFLHNNSLGTFNNDPSVKGRLAAFDDAIGRLLWPDRRRQPSDQRYWPGKGAAKIVPDAWFATKHSDEVGKEQESERPPADASRELAAAQRELDGGWLWRSTEESWLIFNAPHVPMLVGGVVGLSREKMRVVALLPSLAFLLLGTKLLLSRRFIAARERLERNFSWLGWLLGPVSWALSAGGIALAIASGYLVLYKFRPVVDLLDAGTNGYIPLFRVQAFLIPVVLFGSAGLFFLLSRLPEGRARILVPRAAGVACLLLAVVTALGIGRTLAGAGADLKIGPIPEGIPVNIIANINPLAPRSDLINAADAMVKFLVKHRAAALADPGNEAAKAGRRLEFQEKVAPVLAKVSKCPDFVTDRGHDYVFMRDFTDQEKHELIALIKTF